MQKLQEQYNAILDFFNVWQDEWHLYDLQNFHDTEYFLPLEESRFLQEQFDTDLSVYFKDKFISFAVDGAGGEYCFWLYPEFEWEPPIVFLDGHGEQQFLAGSLNDFVNKMMNDIGFRGGWLGEYDDWQEFFKEEHLWDLVESYEEEKNEEISVEEVENLFYKERALFKERASQVITLKTTKEIVDGINKHPDFNEFMHFVYKKNKEIYRVIPFPQESYSQVIDNYRRMQSINFSEYVLIRTITNNRTYQPQFYNAVEFQEWIEENSFYLEQFFSKESSLDLSNQDLKVVPKSILDNLEITHLDLSGNNLAEIPEFISELKQLTHLYLDENNLKELPNFITKMHNLEELILRNNLLKSIDLDFRKLPNLVYFDVSHNLNFSHIDESLFKLTSLHRFIYEETMLEDELNDFELMLKSDSEYILEKVVDSPLGWNDSYLPKIEEVYRRWIGLYPSFYNYYNFANFIQYTRKNNFEEAEDCYKKALAFKEEADDTPILYTNFAKLYYYNLERDFGKAEELYKKAIALDEEDAYAVEMYISFLVYHKEEYKEADKLYNKLLKLEPKNISYKEEYAEFLEYRYEKPLKALKVYKKILKQKPNKKRYLKHYAELLCFEKHEPQKALPIFERLLEKKKSADNYWNIIQALIENDEPEETVKKYLHKALKKHKKNKELITTLVDYLGDIEDYDTLENATYAYKKLAKPATLKIVAIYMDAKKLEKAKQILDEGLEKFPNFESLLFFKLQYLVKSKADDKEIISLAQDLKNKTKNETRKERMDLLIQSKKALHENNSIYDAEIKSLGDNIKALLELATEALANKEIAKALAIVKVAEKKEPYNNEMLALYVNLITITQGDDEVLSFLKNKLDLKKPNIDVLKRLLSLLITQEQDDEALKYLEIGKKHFPKDVQIVKFVEYFESLTIDANSEEEFEVLLKEKPNNVALLLAYSIYALGAENTSKAIEQLHKILDIESDNFSALFTLIQTYYVLVEDKKMHKFIEKALQISPLKTLVFLSKLDIDLLKKYIQIVKEKFPDEKEAIDWIKKVEQYF